MLTSRHILTPKQPPTLKWHGRSAHVFNCSKHGRVARATAHVTIILTILILESGCSASVSLGKKSPPAPAAPATSANAPTLHTTITVPPEAQRLAEGADPVRYTATSDGTLYVFSRDDRQVSLQYDLTSGETFTLTPQDAGAAFTADRHTGAPGRGTLPPSRGGYEVYFLRKGTPTTSPATAPTSP
jgi:hypothetical protein